MEYNTMQGDVDIFSIDKIPKSAKLLKTKTVMYGEKTGHHHTFQGPVQVYDASPEDHIIVDGEQRQILKYVHLDKPTVISHQEHASQKIPANDFMILQEVEWDPLEKQLKRVID